VLGFDPRLQFVHETDLMRVLTHAVEADVPGTFNVAGDGVMLLSQALRRLRRPSVSMPGPAVSGVASLLKNVRMADFSPEQLGLLTFGRGIDTRRMRDELGFEPELSTAEAFADFARSIGPPLSAVNGMDGAVGGVSEPTTSGAGRG
jgi:UDP-glucose 4-epimerase